MSIPSISKEMEIRHLPTNLQLQLVKALDIEDSVLNLLMGSIHKNLDDKNSELRFNSADIDSIREHSERHKKSAILVLLDEWSTMGKTRPKMKHLFDLLIKCQLYQGADFVAKLMNLPFPQRPDTGPAAKINLDLSEDIDQMDLNAILNNIDYPFSFLDITARDNRINNFIKPDINAPDMNFVNNISDENGANNQSTAQSRIFSQQPAESSDLIKFSKTMTSINAIDKNTASMLIPATVNDTETNAFVPALSGLISSSNNSQKSSNVQLPVFLQSMISENHVPDFSGLMNDKTNSYSNDMSSESITDSSINGTR